MNYETLIDYKEENEYFAAPFEIMRHGVTVYLIPRTLCIEGFSFVEE